MTLIHRLESRADLVRGVDLAREALARSEVIAFPVEHAYVVACEPFAPQAITAIQQARSAIGNALPLLIGTQQTLDGIAKPLAVEVRTMLTGFWPGLMTIVVPAAVPWDLGDGGSGTIAIRQPNDPIALALLAHGPLAAVMAAPTGHSAHSAEEVVSALGGVVSVVLDDGSRAPGPASTMVGIGGRSLQIIREGAISLDEIHAKGEGLVIES